MPPEYEIIIEDFANYSNVIVLSPIVSPELSPQRKLLRDRVKLIRVIESIDHITYAKSELEYRTLRLLALTIRADNDNHFLSYSQEDKRMVSYATKPQHKFDNDKRYKTTIGRYIRKQLNVDSDTISDRTLENLAYNLFGELTEPDDLPIEVISGSNITQAYSDCVGGETCMCGRHSRYTRTYEMNPDKVSMVVYDGNARALLWTTDEDVKVLDRIYPNDGSHTRAMKKWAISKGYLVRCHNGCADCDSSRLLGKDQYHVTLKHNDVFPYMDTFMHGQINDGTIVVSNLPMDDDDVILQEQDGHYYEGASCCHCDRSIGHDDAYNVDNNSYCENCYCDLFTECEYCGRTVDRDDILCIDDNYWCERCADNHAQECYGCHDYHRDEDCVRAEDTDRYYCPRCSEDLVTCEECSTLVENHTIGDDDRTRCENCHTNYEESKVESTSVA